VIKFAGMVATAIWVKFANWVDWDGDQHDVSELRAENLKLRQQLAEAKIIDRARAREIEALRKGKAMLS
jgi:hypothetical protein